MTNPTKVERKSDRELVVSRLFDYPPRRVFEAWTTPGLMMKWWAPKSMGVPLRSCQMDVRVGGQYRLEFGQDAASAFAFFGNYTEVVPPSRLVWTNDEGGATSITTITFDDEGGKTRLAMSEVYPSKEALDESMVGMEACSPEQFDQLDALLAGDG